MCGRAARAIASRPQGLVDGLVHLVVPAQGVQRLGPVQVRVGPVGPAPGQIVEQT